MMKSYYTMDSSKKTYNPPQYQEQDTDLNLLLYKSGRTFKNFILWIGRGIAAFGRSLMLVLLYLMRNLVWLLIGAAIGLGYGMYLLSRHGSVYSSEMTVRANFNSSRELYNTMDYINALTQAGQHNELAK